VIVSLCILNISFLCSWTILSSSEQVWTLAFVFLVCGDILVGGHWNNSKCCGGVKTKTQLVLQITQGIVTATIMSCVQAYSRGE
jgi:hypothetical protein